MKPQQQHFLPAWSGNGFMHMNIYVMSANINGIPLTENDEVAVFDKDVCVGATRLREPIQDELSIILSHNDPYTPYHDGYISGNEMIFKVWIHAEQHEYTIPIKAVTFYSGYHYQDKPYFEVMGSSIVRILYTVYSTPQTVAYWLDPDEFYTVDGERYKGPYEVEWVVDHAPPEIEAACSGEECLIVIKEKPAEAVTLEIKASVFVAGTLKCTAKKEVAVYPMGRTAGEPLNKEDQLYKIGKIKGPDSIEC